MRYLSALILSLVSLNALATGKPTTPPESPPQPSVAVAGAAAGAVASSDSRSSAGSWSEGGNATGGAGGEANATGGNSGGNSLTSVYKDRLQAPATMAASVYPSGVCGSGGSLALSIPGGSIGGSKASKEIIGCERREWFRLLHVEHPALALRIACADPVVAAVAQPGDCKYTPPVVVTPPQPVVDTSQFVTKTEHNASVTELKERQDRQFKRGISK